jgi:hypothetical protein
MVDGERGRRRRDPVLDVLRDLETEVEGDRRADPLGLVSLPVIVE